MWCKVRALNILWKKETTLDESEVSLFFLAQYISRSTSIYRALYCGKIEIQTSHLYLYIYTSYKPRFLGLQCNLRSDPWPMQARRALTIPELKWKTPAIPPPPQFRPLISSYCRHFSRDSNVEVFCASTVTWWLLVTYLFIYFSEEVKVNRLTLPLLSL